MAESVGRWNLNSRHGWRRLGAFWLTVASLAAVGVCALEWLGPPPGKSLAAIARKSPQPVRLAALPDSVVVHPPVEPPTPAQPGADPQPPRSPEAPRILYRPRSPYERTLVLARRSWTVPASLFPSRETAEDAGSYFLRLTHFREAHGFPDRLYFLDFEG